MTNYVPEGTTWDAKIRHCIANGKDISIVIGLSAGKDSTAVALLFKETFPELMSKVDFVFADTGSELPETYTYLDKLSKYLEMPIDHVIAKGGTLEQVIAHFNGYLPSPISRYCTRISKITPFRDYMNKLAASSDVVFNLVGIRADEPTRIGYKPCGEYASKVFTEMPLKDNGLGLTEVFKMVEDALGLPDYYKWRTRSGCYFCFYQRRIEWVNLKEQHPDLFEKAKSFEKTADDGKKFTWIKGMSLSELEEKAEAIKKRYAKKLGNKLKKGESLSITDARIFEELMQEEEPELKQSCSTCR